MKIISFPPHRKHHFLFVPFLLSLLTAGLTDRAHAGVPTFVTAPSLDAALADHTATVLPTGDVLLAGGLFDNGTVSDLSFVVDGYYARSAPTGALLEARQAHTAVLLPTGRVLVSGGWNGAAALASQEWYEADSGQWTSAVTLTTARTRHTATLLADGRVLLVGGENAGSLATAEIYDPLANTAQPAAPLTTARHSHTATLLADGRVLVVGGRADEATRDSAEIYDPASSVWTPAGSLTTARSQHSAVRLRGGRVLVIGGFDADGAALASCEVFDPVSGQWTATGSLHQARGIHATLALPNGVVRVLGGEISPTLRTASAEDYDPATGEWSVVKNGEATAAMARPRSGHTATLLPTGRTLIVGGDGLSRTVEIMTYNHGKITPTAASPTAATKRQTTLLPDGRVLVTGGSDFRLNGSVNADIYDFKNGSWIQASSMGSPRASHTSVSLNDGRVLVAGGTTGRLGPQAIVEAEVYNPTDNTWAPVTPMHTARFTPMSILLSDGRVLVIGGRDPGYRPLASAEIYDPGTNTWAQTGSLPHPFGMGRAFPLRDGSIIVVGSLNSQIDGFKGRTGLCAKYDPISNTWTDATPTIATDAVGNPGTISQLADGRILSAGGALPYVTTASCELYDPTTNQWVVTDTPKHTPPFHQSLRLPNGTVLATYQHAAGGIPGYAEIFDPVTRLWSPDAWITLFNGTAVAAYPNGKTLLTGGENHSIIYNDSQIYDPGLNYRPEDQPELTGAEFDSSGRLVLSGAGFRGASGFSFQTADYPVVQLWHVTSNRRVFLLPDPASPWTDTSFVSKDVGGLSHGPAFVTVYVNGIPSEPSPITLPAPQLVVESSETGPLASPATVTFPNVPLYETEVVELTIKNTGAGVLSGIRTSITGSEATAFSASLSAESLPPGGSATLSLGFSSSEGGFHSAILRLDSNDHVGGPFLLHLSAEAVNNAPTISAIADQTILEDTESNLIHFTIGDANTAAEALEVAVGANDHGLLESLILGGEGAERTLRIKPAADRSGTVDISVSVSDGSLLTVSEFTLTIVPVNDPPVLPPLPDLLPLRVNSGAQWVPLNDLSAGPLEQQPLTISVTSDNPGLFSDLRVLRDEELENYASVQFTPKLFTTGRATVTVTVNDGEAHISRDFTVTVLPLITALSAAAPEGHSGTTTLPFHLEINPPHPEPILIRYATEADGTATAGEDFTPATGLLTIPPGATSAVIPVDLIGDTRLEFDETFTLVLVNEADADFLENSRPVGTILNDDAQPALQLTQPWVTVPEAGEGDGAKAWIAVTLPAALDIPLTWKVTTRADTAEAGVHYTPLTLTELVFTPGETTKWLAIDVPAGAADAGDRQFHLDFVTTLGPQTTATATSTIKRLAITDFYPVGQGAFLLRFPGALGQSYIIQQSATLGGPWATASPIIFGGNGPVTQAVLVDTPTSFFRVVAAPRQPEGAP